MTRTLNYALYQAGWFACVLGASWGRPWAGTAIGMLTLAIHLALARRRADELRLILVTSAIGVMVESVQIGFGTLAYHEGLLVAGLPPAWLVVLWMQFATTFRFSLRWLNRSAWVAWLFGAVGGPLVYLVAARLDVVALHPEIWRSVATLAVLWGIAVPLAVAFGQQQDGRAGDGQYGTPWPGSREFRAALERPP